MQYPNTIYQVSDIIILCGVGYNIGFRLTAGEAGALDIYLGEEKLVIPSLTGTNLLENFPIDRRSLNEYRLQPIAEEIGTKQ